MRHIQPMTKTTAFIGPVKAKIELQQAKNVAGLLSLFALNDLVIKPVKSDFLGQFS